jgi:hypothetical protein
MPSILELLEQKQGVVPSIPAAKSAESTIVDDTSKTLEEIYKDKNSFKLGTDYSLVKTDTETRFEQETGGIRISSLVEINNPLIYGNEATRIGLRSTPLTEDMLANRNNGEDGGGDGGAIGKGLSKITGGKVNSLSEVRGKANTFLQSKLGLPITQIPSRIVTKIDGSNDFNSSTQITPELIGGQGNALGGILKGMRGNPSTMGKQALAGGVNLAKDKLRGALFGNPDTIGDNNPGPVAAVYNTSEEHKNYSYTSKITDEITKDSFKDTPLDLSLVSPIHGVKRPAKGDNQSGVFGRNSKFALSVSNAESAQSYSPVDKENYSSVYKERDDKAKTLQERGLSNAGDVIAMGDPYTSKVNVETGEVDIPGFGKVKDLVPLFIGRYDSTTYPMMAFRCAITGLTETSSPSWASNNFVGNPYKYYIFESVERSVSFNLQIYSQSPLELANNWSKLTNLTKLSYPLIEKNMAHPNFTQFTLGDMYKDKVCIVESLSYTFPDNGTWETNIEGLILPKFIDVAITLKFVENIADGSIDGADTPGNNGLYSYPKNDNATGHDLRTGDGAGTIASQHQIYENADRYIKYHTIGENGETNEVSKNIYADERAAGKRVGIKIKV